MANTLYEGAEFLVTLSPHETKEDWTCDTVGSTFTASDLTGVTAEDVKGAANVEITNTLEDGTVQKITTDGQGDVTTTSSGNKQYAADAVIGEGFSEIYNGSVVVGYSKYVDGLPVAADDGKFKAEVIVEGSLTANGTYLWIGGDTGTAERFGLVVDGGTVSNRKGEGTYLRPQGYLEVLNGGTFDGCLINASDSRVQVEGTSSEDKSTIYLTSNALNATNTEVTIGKFGQLIMKEDPSLGGNATINLKEGSTLKVEKDGYVENTVNNTTIDSDSTFEVAGGTVDLKNVINDGTFKVTGGTVSATSVTNNGTFNVSGTSTLDIENMIGTIVAADGATLNNSVIKGGTDYTHVELNGYKYVLSVNGDKAGTLNFAGTNTIQNIEAGAGDIVNVKNATLNFVSGSDGFKLGNGATWNIENANVGGAWALSLDGAYMTDDENAPVSTLNAKGSTFTLNQISAKGTKDDQEIGYGTFNVNFADSKVNLANRLQIQEQETATVNIKFAENSTLTALHFSNFSTKGTVTFNASNAEFTQNFGNIGKVNVENGAVLSVTYGSIGTGLVPDANGAYAEKSNGNSGTITVNGGTMSLTSAGALSTFTNSGTIAVIGGTFSADSLTNNGTMTVSGESTVKGAFTGNGWVYMNGASLDSNTEITGANVRFASGDNVVDGAAIDNVRFQVGTGTYQASDEMVDTKNGVTVTVKNNAHIEGIDGSLSPYGGWVGSEYYDSQDDKTAAMTDARYTLNIENSIADFGYMHVSHDGIMNVTGNADNLETIGGVDYTFRAGTLNINGVVTFDSSIAAVIGTGVSVDNQTDNPGKLIITNGAVYNAAIDDNRKDAKFTIYEKGIVEVNNEGVLKIGTLINFSSNGELNITDRGTVESVVAFTNNGAITIDSTSLLKAEDITMGESATITLNVAEDFSGYHKFIDLDAGNKYTADENLDVNFDVDVKDLGLTVIHSDDGDVALVKVDPSNLFVDTTWANVTEGPVSIDGVEIENMFKGTNAFSSMTDALEKAEENMENLEEGKVTIEVMANTDAMDAAHDIRTAGTYVITGGSGKNIGEVYLTEEGINFSLEDARVGFAKFAIGETSTKNLYEYPDLPGVADCNVTIKDSRIDGFRKDTNSYFGINGGSNVTIDKSVFGFLSDVSDDEIDAMGADNSGEVSVMVFTTGGIVDVTDSVFATGRRFSITDRGIVTFSDNSKVFASTLNVGYSPAEEGQEGQKGYRNGSDASFSKTTEGVREGEIAELVLEGGSVLYRTPFGNGNDDGAFENSGIRIGGARDDEAGKLTVTDNAKLIFTNNVGGSTRKNDITLAANGTLLVSDGGYVETVGVVTNAGTITLDGTEETVTFNANEVVNNGTVTVTGESKLEVNKLVGTLNVADATISDGSFIKGKAGSVDISGSEVNFDGNVTIEAALNSNKSSDATIINVNDGAVVTIAGKEYDLYNGGVNLGSTDTLNVDGTLNITAGDNVYLKATTNVAEGGALNITDAGFQNTYGKLTVKGAMNITDTFEDGAYQNIKLAGNDNASTTGSLDVDGGTLTIDAPSFAFGGGFKSSGWVDVTSADVTVQNGGKITSNAVVFRNGVNSTVTLDNGTFEFTAAPDFGTVHETLGTQIDNNGTIIAKNGSTLDFGDRPLVNKGTITVTGSTFAAAVVENTGTFSIGAGVDGTADKNVIKIGTLNGTLTLNDEAYIDEGSLINGGTITVKDDATLYWGTVSGAAITVGEDLAFEGVEFDAKEATTIYTGAVAMMGNELIINGESVVWNDSSKATGNICIDDVVYKVTVSDTAITAAVDDKATDSVPEYKFNAIGNVDGNAEADVVFGVNDKNEIKAFGSGTSSDVLWGLGDWEMEGVSEQGIIISHKHVNDDNKEKGPVDANTIAILHNGNDNGTLKHVDVRGFDLDTWELLGAADVNGDGIDDILTVEIESDTNIVGDRDRHVMAWILDQDGNWTADARIGGLSKDWNIKTMGDINGDGKDEVILQHTGENGYTMAWDFNVEKGAEDHISIGDSPYDLLGAGDFDGNGYDDLLWISDEKEIYWSSASDINNMQKLGDVGALQGFDEFLGIGDFNGDGTDDLLWKDYTGAVAWNEADENNWSQINKGILA